MSWRAGLRDISSEVKAPLFPLTGRGAQPFLDRCWLWFGTAVEEFSCGAGDSGGVGHPA